MAKEIRSVAPGRICLLGDHQDYLLLPIIACAIDRQIEIIAIENEENRFNIFKEDLAEHVVLELDPSASSMLDHHGKPDFLKLALKVCKRHGCVPTRGYDLRVRGSIPINAGLSSSSALIVAFIQFLIVAFGMDGLSRGEEDGDGDGDGDEDEDGDGEQVPPALLARLAWETEVLELNTSGGKMDHYSICIAGMIYLNTKADIWEEFKFAPLPGGLSLVVGVSGDPKDTNATLSHLKTHQLSAIRTLTARKPDFRHDELLVPPVPFSELDLVSRNPEVEAEARIQDLLALMTSDDVEISECPLSARMLRPYLHAALMNHHITAQALETLRALRAGSLSSAQTRLALKRLGALVSAHHGILRDDLKNSTPTIERMIGSALAVEDCLGAKIVGSGGGGCVVALVLAPQAQNVANAMLRAGAKDSFVVQSLSAGPRVSVIPSQQAIRKREREADRCGDIEPFNVSSLCEDDGGSGKLNTEASHLVARAARNKAIHDSFVKSGRIEDTPDDANKRVFANFLLACKHYDFPGSHQHGSTSNANGVIRTYSNSTPGKDRVLRGGHEIHYRLKSVDVQRKFSLNMASGQKVRFFRKVENGCKDMGLFNVAGFIDDDAFVRLLEE
jgi:galactokinase